MRRKSKGKRDKVVASSATFVSIKKALENPRFTFRTIKGVAQEAGVKVADVEMAIRHHPDEVVVLYRRGQNGELLVTTRAHYKKKASLKEKIMGAVLNRVY